MAASSAHARQASVNEPSGARRFSGDWVDIGHCAYDHGAEFELGLELALSWCSFPLLPEVKIEWLKSGEHGGHVRLLQKSFGAPAGVKWRVVFLPPSQRQRDQKKNQKLLGSSSSS